MIALSGLALHLTLARQLDRMQVFDQANILFDADPDEVLDTLAAGGYGSGTERQGFIHPGMRLFLTAPIKVAALVISTVSLDGRGLASWRRHLALATAPISAALFYAVFFLILLRLGLRPVNSSLLTLLAALSFSQLLFGSVPESFPVSNLALGVAFLLFVLPHSRHEAWRAAAWLAIGMFAAGVTVTNILSVAILIWFDSLSAGTGPIRSAARALTLSLAALILILSLNVVSNRAVGIDQPVSPDTLFVADFAERAPMAALKKFLTFPALVVNTLVAPPLQAIPDAYARRMSWRYVFRVTFDVDRERGSSTNVLGVRNLMGAVGLLLVVVAVAKLGRAKAQQRQALWLCCACLMVIAFNWLFHSFWGGDRFLYSQHWEAALMLLLAMMIRTYAPASPHTTVALTAAVFLVGFNNVTVLRGLFALLRGV